MTDHGAEQNVSSKSRKRDSRETATLSVDLFLLNGRKSIRLKADVLTRCLSLPCSSCKRRLDSGIGKGTTNSCTQLRSLIN